MITKSHLFLLSLLIIFPLPMLVEQQENNSGVVIIDGEYNIEIIASQWQFEAIDLNRVKILVDGGMEDSEARTKSTYIDSIGNFQAGSKLNLAVRSRDVQHGFELKYVNADEIEQSIKIATQRPLPNELYGSFTNETLILPSISQSVIAQCYIFCGLGHIDMKLEFIIVEQATKTTLDLGNLVLIFTVISTVAGVSYITVKVKKTSSLGKILLTGEQRTIISEIFQSKTSLYYYLMGYKTQKEIPDFDKLEKPIPQDLFKFKFLLNPVRLSITKLLYENLRLSSSDLKDMLGVSWNDVRTHLTALESKGYIRTKHEFIDGIRKQLVELEILGIEEYKILLDTLHLFLDNSSAYDGSS